MRHNLDGALALIRKSLRSRVPHNRIRAAAVLAVINLPWSRKELAAVLSETTDQEMTTECRCALMESPEASDHEIVDAWERDNPYEPSDDRFPTFGELAKRRDDRRIHWEIEQVRETVEPMRESFTYKGWL